MRAKIFCRTGALAGVDQRIDASVSIGRGEGNDLTLSSPVISQSHARIFRDPASQHYVLEDLDSRNGTRLDGIRVEGRRRLGRLHVVTFGEEHDFLFVTDTADVAPRPAVSVPAVETGKVPVSLIEMPQLEKAHPSGEAQPDASKTVHAAPGPLAVPPLDASRVEDGAANTVLERPAPMAVPPLEPGPETAEPTVVLEIICSDGSSVRHELATGRHEIGRAPGCAVVIHDRTLSRRHALLIVEGGEASIADQGSLHGTFLAGQPVSTPVALEPGVEVMFGEQVRARLVEPQTGEA